MANFVFFVKRINFSTDTSIKIFLVLVMPASHMENNRFIIISIMSGDIAMGKCT